MSSGGDIGFNLNTDRESKQSVSCGAIMLNGNLSPRLKSVFLRFVVNSLRLCHGPPPFAFPNQHDFALVAVGDNTFFESERP